MPKIHVLPEELINKIAAGEVVERPASIVKELLDNALDAKADQIHVDIEEGGIKKILIVDNGTGMDPEDAKLAFKHHATSKLSSENDLLNIQSYGFRGEALSSIAAVSRVTLKTRGQSESLGTEIKVEGGEIKSTSETGAQTGTSVLVEDLFYNTPARKEFLKSPKAEYKAILHIVNAHAIANPMVGITLKHNEKTIYSFPKDQHLEDRIRSIMGADFYEKLLPIFFEHPHIEIYGLTGKPEAATERKGQQYIFVNNRAISNRQISYAVKSAYGTLIPKTAYPSYIIFIDTPPNIVDVNVHPRKEEVKFSNENLIFDSVKSAVKKSLDKANLAPGAVPKQQPASPFAKPTGAGSPFASPLGKSGSPSFGKPRTPPPFRKPGGSPASKPPFGKPPLPSKDKSSPFKSQYANTFFDEPFGGDDIGMPRDPALTSGGNHSWQQQARGRHILQIHNLYLIVQSEDGITIYDQHAVHERIIYENLLKAHKDEKEKGGMQAMFAPVVINLSIHETETFEENKNLLEQAGFGIEDFGPNSYKITKVPTVMMDKDIKSIMHELIQDLEEESQLKDVDSQNEKMLTYLACRSAYKAGDPIPPEEAQALIDQLDKTDTKYTCPHGRPVKVEITMKELSKMFKRT